MRSLVTSRLGALGGKSREHTRCTQSETEVTSHRLDGSGQSGCCTLMFELYGQEAVMHLSSPLFTMASSSAMFDSKSTRDAPYEISLRRF